MYTIHDANTPIRDVPFSYRYNLPSNAQPPKPGHIRPIPTDYFIVLGKEKIVTCLELFLGDV